MPQIQGCAGRTRRSCAISSSKGRVGGNRFVIITRTTSWDWEGLGSPPTTRECGPSRDAGRAGTRERLRAQLRGGFTSFARRCFLHCLKHRTSTVRSALCDLETTQSLKRELQLNREQAGGA